MPENCSQCRQCQGFVEQISGSALILLLFLGLDVAGQRRDERFLRHLDATNHLHTLLTFLLLLEQLALTADVTAVALSKNVFSDGTNGFASDDAGANGGLNRNLELLARDQLRRRSVISVP